MTRRKKRAGATATVTIQCAIRCRLARNELAKRREYREHIKHALGSGTENHQKFLVKKCFGSLKKAVVMREQDDAATIIQCNVRGRQGRRRAKAEKLVLYMRGT